MSLELQIISAFLMDQVLGDPRSFPHPVKYIGGLAHRAEAFFRKRMRRERGAGIATVVFVLSVTAVSVWLILVFSEVFPLLGDAVSVYLLYTAIAAKDLAKHSRNVYRALAEENLSGARKRVAMIVGRDTEALNEQGVSRACVESVAENLVDGVTAPLFWAVVCGPVGAILYKAVNTMDSLFGYKNEKYIHFGWAAARLDDLANWVPARLTALVLVVVSFFLRLDGKRAWITWRRDREKHASPNSGHTEAAAAGALRIQLGGSNYYFGRLVDKPVIGDAIKVLEPADILRANRLMLVTSIFTGMLFILFRWVVL